MICFNRHLFLFNLDLVLYCSFYYQNLNFNISGKVIIVLLSQRYIICSHVSFSNNNPEYTNPSASEM